MFQYAASRALSLRLNVPLKLDVSDFQNYKLHQGFELQRIFGIKAEIANELDLKKIIGFQALPFFRTLLKRPQLKKLRVNTFLIEPTFHFWSGFEQINDNSYVNGYWQSEKYFKYYEKNIREDFRFKVAPSIENKKILDELEKVNAVSLHVRRGDYQSNPQNASVYALCSLDYYSTAIAYVAKNVKNPNFLIFSDDIEWCKNNLNINYPHQYITHNQDKESYNDMRLMSMCKHNIIANSSFSWWGAWLNPNPDKIVIAPEKWFVNNTNDSDLIPATWLKL